MVTFGEAVLALKEGKRVQRKGWNGSDLFVFRQVPAEISVEEVVPKMQSLPQSVKDEFLRRLERGKFMSAPSKQVMEMYGSIKYDNQLAIVKPNNEINGWAPSITDILAEDWIIHED